MAQTKISPVGGASNTSAPLSGDGSSSSPIRLSVGSGLSVSGGSLTANIPDMSNYLTKSVASSTYITQTQADDRYVRQGSSTGVDVDDIYPVGSLYITASHTSPASLFGGSWSRTANGRALWGAGMVGSGWSPGIESTIGNEDGSITLDQGRAAITLQDEGTFHIHATAPSAGIRTYQSEAATRGGGVDWSVTNQNGGAVLFGRLPVYPPAIAYNIWKRVS